MRSAELQDKVDEGLDKGEISAEDAQRLDDAIQGLASAVSAGEDQSGGEDGERRRLRVDRTTDSEGAGHEARLLHTLGTFHTPAS